MKQKGRFFLDIVTPVVLYSVVLLAAQFVVMLALALIFIASHTGGDISGVADKMVSFLQAKVFLISLLGNVLTLGVIFADSKIRKVKLSDYTQLSKPIGVGGSISAVLCGLSFSVWLSVMLSLLPIPESWISDYAEASSGLGETSLLAIIAVGVLGPIVEEMVFRGIIYKHLNVCMPEYLALVLQAIIFASLHGDTVIWVSYAFLGGLLFGYVRMLTGSIRATILAHMAFNLAGYVIVLLGDTVTMLLVAASPVLLILSVRYMYKKAIKAE